MSTLILAVARPIRFWYLPKHGILTGDTDLDMKIKRSPKKRQANGKSRLKRAFLHRGGISRKDAPSLVIITLIIFCVTILVAVAFWLGKNNNGGSDVLYSYLRKTNPLEKKIRSLVKGYPIENMAPDIAKQDPEVASLLVGIAKKESAWGKRKPVLDGQDCYNYWGFRQERERMGSGGHTCFDSPSEAVETVSKRISELVNEEKLDTPGKMIVWKCGYECLGREKTESERKWIRDVNFYYEKMMR